MAVKTTLHLQSSEEGGLVDTGVTGMELHTKVSCGGNAEGAAVVIQSLNYAFQINNTYYY